MGNKVLLERDLSEPPEVGYVAAGDAAASKHKKAKLTAAPRVSIIIPAHNEEDYLRKTLEALERLQYPDYEVVVVANGCTGSHGGDRPGTV